MFASAYTYLPVRGIRKETALGPLCYLPQADSKEQGGRRVFQTMSETCMGAAWKPCERVQIAGVKWAIEVMEAKPGRADEEEKAWPAIETILVFIPKV